VGALILDESNRVVETIFPLPHRGRGTKGERPSQRGIEGDSAGEVGEKGIQEMRSNF